MSELKLTIQTLTPIWTGGSDGTMDRLHETGLIGSLRWWYEVIVRGIGGHACDPTVNPCKLDKNFDIEKYQKTNNSIEKAAMLRAAGLCDACQVFGATGWKRRFRLEVDSNGLKKDEQAKSWNLKSNPFKGNFNLKIIPQSRDYDSILIVGILKLIERVGGLGAKNQLGFGSIVVKYDNFSARDFVNRITITKPEPSDEFLPNLQKMFFCNLDDAATIEERKKYLREILTEIDDEGSLIFLCGSLDSGGKINYSELPNNITRVWGWIPEPDKGIYFQDREEVVEFIEDKFYDSLEDGSWVEYHSNRDKKHLKSTEKDFLLDLLQGGNHD